VGLNIWLFRQTTEQAMRLTAMIVVPPLSPGDVVPDLDLQDEKGATTRLSFANTEMPTVLYVMSPTCVWCDRNIQAVNALADATATRYRAIALSLGDPKSATAYRPKLKLPIYTGISDKAAKAYRIRSTPTTIVIGRDNRVVRVWSGAFAGGTRTEVADFFSVRLPEIDTTWASK
jgi:peroxiredoxin